ncbi:MAG: hypothetical protein M3273_06240, partial [Actinomycetota bacterium]|nr:hypothetical protein [Actinomycetota bacterium]
MAALLISGVLAASSPAAHAQPPTFGGCPLNPGGGFVNPGFETGDLTGWGSPAPFFQMPEVVGTDSGVSPYHGDYMAKADEAEISNLGEVSLMVLCQVIEVTEPTYTFAYNIVSSPDSNDLLVVGAGPFLEGIPIAFVWADEADPGWQEIEVDLSTDIGETVEVTFLLVSLDSDDDTVFYLDAAEGDCGNGLIEGDGAPNSLCGGDGVDTIFGHGDDDTLRGGLGGDDLRGGANGDDLFGEGGRDTLRGGDGWDDLDGGPGFDVCFGGPGRDVFTGGPGADTIRAVDGNREEVNCGDGDSDEARVDP